MAGGHFAYPLICAHLEDTESRQRLEREIE